MYFKLMIVMLMTRYSTNLTFTHAVLLYIQYRYSAVRLLSHKSKPNIFHGCADYIPTPSDVTIEFRLAVSVFLSCCI